MNEDCLFLIVERLDFDDLLNVAQIHKKFSMVAADSFHRQYSHLEIFVEDMFPLPENPNELFNVADMAIDINAIQQVNKHFPRPFRRYQESRATKTQIELESFDAILNVFKHFGHLFKKLKSRTDSRECPVQSELIGRLISKHCSESLVEIEIERDAQIMLEYMTKPLINVESVTFSENKMSFNPRKIHINEIFPALRRLTLYDLSVRDLAYFDHLIPHLEHVIIRQSKYQYTNFPLPDVITRNPQLRSIHLHDAEPVFLQKLNTQMPQLETLELSNFELKKGSIRFENVTTFISGKDYKTSPENLHFPRLQTLQINIDVDYKVFDRWFAFLNEHIHLKQLHLQISVMNDDTFQRLTANLADLEEMKLKYYSLYHQGPRVSPNVTVEFLRSHAKVIRLNAINFPEEFEVELQQQMKRDWNVRVIDGGLYFERKTNNQL